MVNQLQQESNYTFLSCRLKQFGNNKMSDAIILGQYRQFVLKSAFHIAKYLCF